MAKLKNPISIKVFLSPPPLPNSDSLTEGLILNEEHWKPPRSSPYLKDFEYHYFIFIQKNQQALL